MRFIRCLPALLLLLLLPVALAEARWEGSPTLERIAAAGEVRVGLTGDYKPFSWEEPEGHFEGLDVDMAEALAADLDARLVIVRTSWPTLMDDLAAGKFDIAMGGISITEARAAAAFFTDPILADGKAPIARCADKDRFQTLEEIDREGVTVIVNPGGTNEQFARANISRATLALHTNNATIFEEIVEGRADVMMTDAIETRIMAREHPELCAINPDKPFTRAEKAYLLPQDDVFKTRVDDWLGRLEAIGALQQTIRKWTGVRPE